MSAPVAIPAAVTAGQATPAGNAWAQAGATPATGFETLLAALFPTASPGLVSPVKGGLGLVKDATAAATEPQADNTAATGTDTSAVQAQLAALLAVQPAQAQPTTTAPGDTADTLKTAPQTLPPATKPEPVLPGQAPVQTVAQADAAPTAQFTVPAAREAPAAPLAPVATKAPEAPPAAAAPAPTTDQPPVLPAVEPKAPPPAPVLAAALAPQLEVPAESAAEAPAEPPPALAVAVAAAAPDAKPVAKTEKPEAPATVRPASATPAATPAAQTETALAAQPAQAPADNGHDQPSPDQRETASSDKSAPDIVAAPASGPTSAAHMIQAEAAATAARGAPETVAKLAAQIVKKLEGKSSRFDIALDPVGLGKVDVKVEINAQGQMTAALNFDTAAAAAELRGRASELRAALEQAGFDMSNGNLSFSFAGQQDSSGQAFAQQDGRRGNARVLQAFADDQPVAAPVSTSSLLGARTSGVDVRI